MKIKDSKKAERFRKSRDFQIARIEGKREEIRRKQKEIVTHGSRFDSSMDTQPGDSMPDLPKPKR